MSALKIVTCYLLLVTCIFVFLYAIPFTLNPVLAQVATPSTKTSTPSASIATPSANLVNPTLPTNTQPLGYVTPNSPQGVNLFVINLMHSFTCIVAGQSATGDPCVEYLSKVNPLGVRERVPVLANANLSGGLLGFIGGVMGAMYDVRPIQTSAYLADLGQGLGLVEEAHAQVPGAGSTILNPILKLWTVSRNIAYLVMIIIFVIIGLMIMFRSKINPQTVISLQAALPGLIIGLILITFSYFLASLITDMAFFATNLIGFYFRLAGGTTLPGALTTAIDQENVLTIIGQFISSMQYFDLSSAAATLLNSVQGFPKTVLLSALALAAYQYGAQVGQLLGVPIAAGLGALGLVFGPPGGLIGAAAGATAGSIIGPALGGTGAAIIAAARPGDVLAIAAYVILFAILLYTMFRLLLKLVNNYLNIVFLTITAPFHFLISSLPGRQEVATDWARNMLCNVLAFPAVLGVFFFVAYLLGLNSAPFYIDGVLRVTSQGALPLFGGLDLNFIKILLAYGALLATPAIPDIICDTIGKVGRAGSMFENAINQGSGAGQRYVGQTTENVQRAGQQYTEFFTPKTEYELSGGYQYEVKTPSGLQRVLNRGARKTFTRV